MTPTRINSSNPRRSASLAAKNVSVSSFWRGRTMVSTSSPGSDEESKSPTMRSGFNPRPFAWRKPQSQKIVKIPVSAVSFEKPALLWTESAYDKTDARTAS